MSSSNWISKFFARKTQSSSRPSAVNRGLPRLEALEERAVPATFLVTNTNDSGAGSLRQAVLDANAAGGADLVQFSGVSGTIALTSGQLTLTGQVTIDGPGASSVTVSGSNLSRVFQVSGPTATIDGLTITGGNVTSIGGAGINNEGGALTVTDCVVTANAATTTGGFGQGGAGIRSSGGTLNLTGCVISNNTLTAATTFDQGGGGVLITNGGTSSITNCTIDTNSSSLDYGGLYNQGGNLTMTGTTVSNNTATGSGGGMRNGYSAISTIVNSTFSGNVAGGTTDGGGGLIITSGSVTLRHSTFTNNRVTNTAGNGGGGILNESSLTIDNTIVAGNFIGTGTSPNDLRNLNSVSGSSSRNLIGNGTNSGLTNGVNGNIVGTAANPINPLLGPLAFNGGPTKTHGLLPGSPAINNGTNPTGLAFDQRGPGFPRTVGGATDIGAFEGLIGDDYGDAPAGYGTATASHGAAGPTLGTSRDIEPGPAGALDGTGDDATGTDDEDGVSISPLAPGGFARATVSASGAGVLSAWVDFNGNGTFEAAEAITAAGGTAVVAGPNTIDFPVPAGAVTGGTFARFRLVSTGPAPGPTGSATDGEIEDYAVSITRPTTVVVDDDFATTATPGADPDGAAPATAYGYDAFAVLQQGIDVVANNGTVHVAAGTYAGADAATATKNVTLSPGTGASPADVAAVTVTGLSLNTGDTLLATFNSAASFDVVTVNGAVNVSGATLATNGTFTPVSNSGERFVVIANDATDGVVGTFNGGQFGFVSINGTSARVFHNGGDGNDVELIVTTQSAIIAGGDLYVLGGAGNDIITVNSSNPADVKVTVNGVMQVNPEVGSGGKYALLSPETPTTPAGTDHLIVLGFGGNDTITLSGSVNSEVYGGDGDDYITGGVANDIIFGEAGNDLAYGGDGNDVIVGGTGTLDRLNGDAGDDILIGGFLKANENSGAANLQYDYPALRGISDTWAASAGGMAGAVAASSDLSTPADDVTDTSADKDRLNGGAGDDWFILSTQDSVLGGTSGGDFVNSF